MGRRGGLISYEEFQQRVRRHRTTAVLDAVATASVALTERDYQQRDDVPYSTNVQHWSLAAVAKAAVVAGNDHRSVPVTSQDIEEMCAAFIAVEEPFSRAPNAPGSLAAFLIRVAYEQFPSQHSVFADLARTQALLGDSAASVDQDVINPGFWTDALGCSLTDFVGVAFLMNVGAIKNGGYYDPAWMAQPNFEEVFVHLPRDVIESVSARHFLATRDMFRSTAEMHRQSDIYLRRFEFNPLVVHPFVEHPDGRFIAPCPGHALTRATPTGLYYVGLKQASTNFTQALGPVFEHYVGLHLGLLQPDVLLHDVEYRRGQRAADWVVVLPEVVLVVEVKVAPLTEGARLGTNRLGSDLERTPGKAIDQIDNTARLIAQRDPAFNDVPTDRPVIGIIVTLEPYYQCNSDLVWSRTPGETPIVLASSRELEQLVTISDRPVGDFLLELVADAERSRWNLANTLGNQDLIRNPILEQAWDCYPFRDNNPADDQ